MITAPVTSVNPTFAHVARLTDSIGIFEHASGAAPRPERGYCLDDAARALVVVTRELAFLDTYPTVDPDSPPLTAATAEDDIRPTLTALAQVYFTFGENAMVSSGGAHNRRDVHGQWTDDPGGGDWWGRAMWAFGIVATSHPDRSTRSHALGMFRRGARWTTRDLRAAAYATLGAVALLEAPETGSATQAVARRVASNYVRLIPQNDHHSWPWPEERLGYANGLLPEALIAGGVAVGDPAAARYGFELLQWLLDEETREGHLSVTGAGGQDPDADRPQFDQQPIEVEALAGACARAHSITRSRTWRSGVRSAWRWFLGDNDVGTPMIDPKTGAGYDGLTPNGRNDNRGAESTLAALSTFQHARALGVTKESP